MRQTNAIPLFAEPTLFPPEGIEYAGNLHRPGGLGQVILATKNGPKTWNEHAVPISELGYALRYFSRIDSYITQNRFKGNHRKITDLIQGNALWSDIDFYRLPELTGKHPQLVAEWGLEILDHHRMPHPSVIIASGFGLYFVWLHEAIPPSKLADWNACQDKLHSILAEIGSDAGARDAARVLRIPGTINTKNNRTVEVISPGRQEVWNFEDLCYEILGDEPIRTQVHSFEYEAIKRGRKSSYFHPQRWNASTLWALRWEELKKLKEFRWPRTIPVGYRDRYLFLAGVALSWITFPETLRRELSYLTRQCQGNWKERDTEGTIEPVLGRLNRAFKGEKITWRGLEIDPRYRFRTDSIIEWLGITDEEMRQLNFRGLISQGIFRERDALRKAIVRNTCGDPHTSGIQSHRDYQYRPHSQSTERQQPWEAQGISRATYYRRQERERSMGGKHKLQQ